MEDVIEKIKNLASKYPNHVTTYPSCDSIAIDEYESGIEFKLDSGLKKFFAYSNGISFLDYCIPGLNNKQIADLAKSNSYDPLEFNSEQVVIFLGTSGYHEFGYFYDSNSNQNKVVMISPEEYEISLIANSVQEFMEKFVSKLEIMFSLIDPDEIIMYLDDPDLPSDLNNW